MPNTNLGVAYYNGQGVSKDSAESMKWFRMAAEQGHAGAQCILGISYSDGHVVPQDYLLAYFWTSLASKSYKCGVTTVVQTISIWIMPPMPPGN